MADKPNPTSPSRKKKEIMESIKNKLVQKYGEDEHTRDAINKSLLKLEKEAKTGGTLSAEKFDALEKKLQRQLEAIKYAKNTLRNQNRAKEYRHTTNLTHFGLGGIHKKSSAALETMKANEAEDQMKEILKGKRDSEYRKSTNQYNLLQQKVVDDKSRVKLPKIQEFYDPAVNESSLQKFTKQNTNTSKQSPKSELKTINQREDYHSLKRTYVKQALQAKNGMTRNSNFQTMDQSPMRSRNLESIYERNALRKQSSLAELGDLAGSNVKIQQRVKELISNVKPLKIEPNYTKSVMENSAFYLYGAENPKLQMQGSHKTLDGCMGGNFSIGKEAYETAASKAYRSRAKSVLKTTPNEYSSASKNSNSQMKTTKDILSKYATAGKTHPELEDMQQTHNKAYGYNANTERDAALKGQAGLMHGKDPRHLEKMGINIIDPAKVSLSPEAKHTINKQIAVWDALVLADTNRYEQERQKKVLQKTRRQQELKSVYDQQLQQRKMKEMSDKLVDIQTGQQLGQEAMHLKSLATQQQKHKKEKINNEMIEGVLKNLDTKIHQQELDHTMEKRQYETSVAHQNIINQRLDQQRVKREQMVKTVQIQNKLMMDQRKNWGYDTYDQKLVEKIGSSSQLVKKKKDLQENSPLGGNLYFELNNLAYNHDQEKRRGEIKDNYNQSYTSPIKNYAIYYDQERGSSLDQLAAKHITSEGIFRNDSGQQKEMFERLRNAQSHNKTAAQQLSTSKRQQEDDIRATDRQQRLKGQQSYEQHLDEVKTNRKLGQQHMAKYLIKQNNLKKLQETMDQKLVNEKELRYNKDVLRHDLALEHL